MEEDYCVKVTRDEQPTIEESLKKAKTAFDEVLQDSDAAAVIGGNPVSTISTATTTFNDELKSRIDAIKTTGSNLEQANKAVIAKLKEVTSQVQECSAAMTNFSMLSDPTNGFSAGTVISLIKQGKLNADNIGSTLAAIQKENDAKAIEYALVGDYEKYFDLDPTKISEVPNQLLVLKLSDALHLPEGGEAPIGQPQFQAIMNQLLKSGSEVHIEGHLANMMKASDALALQYASLLAGGMDEFDYKITPTEKTFLENKLAKMNAMGSLYMTLQAIEMPDEASGYAGDHNIKVTTKYEYVINELKLTGNKGFDFYIETTSKISGGDYGQIEGKAKKSYRSNYYESLEAKDLANDRSKLYQIQKERQEYLNNLAKSKLIAVVGIFNPVIGSGLQFLDNLASKNNSGTIKSASTIGKKLLDKKSPYYKGLNTTVKVTEDLLGVMYDYQAMLEKAKAENKTVAKNMTSILLGEAGRAGKELVEDDDHNIFVAEVGIPTPKSIQRLNELNAHGISKYKYTPQSETDAENMGTKIEQVKEILTRPEKKGEERKKLTKAQEYVMGIGGHKLGDEGCSPNQVTNALEEFANAGGIELDDLYENIKKIPET